jgi:pimeloyl-ACP methyl ester carboxylesterase
MDLMPATEKENAKTVVLLHGKNFSGYYWERVAKELLQLNYRVIIPDQIGFGKSSKPNSYQHSFGQFSINTNKLLDSLGVSNYELVGHSMGGMLAITNAYLNPRKVSKLILINPIGLENYLDYSKFKDPDFFFEREKAKTPQKIRAYQKKELL